MHAVHRAVGWAAGAIALGAADLYAVGAPFTRSDAALVALGALPVVAFGAFVLHSPGPHGN